MPPPPPNTPPRSSQRHSLKNEEVIALSCGFCRRQVRTGKPSTQMEWRTVTNNVVIANYGGSKQVDNDDGSLFWRVHSNFMAYGWVSDSDAFLSCRGMPSR